MFVRIDCLERKRRSSGHWYVKINPCYWILLQVLRSHCGWDRHLPVADTCGFEILRLRSGVGSICAGIPEQRKYNQRPHWHWASLFWLVGQSRERQMFLPCLIPPDLKEALDLFLSYFISPSPLKCSLDIWVPWSLTIPPDTGLGH
jgi:hypothetical protein